ncbi:MAG: type II toxin-antitoxin system VapC family toxin [Terriglobales bacterium]
MKAFFDTSVLIAAILLQHEHHQPSAAVFLKADKKNSCCGAHTLAEVYAGLTRMPGGQRMGGDRALLFLDQIRERLTIIALDEDDYYSAIASAVAQGIAGGTIYDALLGQCALKAHADTIYTWDLNHFRLLGAEVARRVRTP